MPPPGRRDRQTLTQPPSAGTEVTDVSVARELGPDTTPSAVRNQHPVGPFLGRRPTATPSVPSCAPGTWSCSTSLGFSSHLQGDGCHALRGSVLLLLPRPLAAPGNNSFALRPLGGARRVLGALSPAHRRALWQPGSRVPSVRPGVCGMRSLARADARCGDPQ